MFKYIHKKISLIILVLFLIGRIVSPFAVLAEAPSAPSAPSAPTYNNPPPQPPSSPNSLPSAPSAPSGPSSPPTAPSAPSGPSSPPSNISVPPTNPPAPTIGSLPTENPLPTLVNTVTPYDQNNTSNPANGSSFGESSGNSSSGSGSSDSYNSAGNVNDPANTYTGPYSTNYGQEILDVKMEKMNKNIAELQNKIDEITSTGFNYANLNTLDGKVFTGDNLATLNLLNKLNSNITGLGSFSVFNIYDTHIGDIVFNFADGNILNAFNAASATVAKNSVTGPGSSNTAISDGSFTVKEATGNDAKITNDIVLESVTGQNEASFNTGNGIIQTGDATALGNIINLANTNLNVTKWLFGVVNIFGTLLGNIVLPQDTADNSSNQQNAIVSVGNSDTGPYSTNYASFTDEKIASFSATNNADIVSKVDVGANTGNNASSINTGGGLVVSGSADAAVSNSTVANTNTIDEEGTVYMIIVNEMGKWVGHIIGAPWGSNSASNGLPITTQTGGFGGQTFTTEAQNSITGPFSYNNSSITQKSEETYETVNDAAIENNIKTYADSGNNEAIYNTGAGMIQTGDAKVGLNLVNMVNTNVIAKKFVAVLVNVLGSFLGDVIPTGQYLADYQVSNNNNNLPAPLPTLVPSVTLEDTNSNIGGGGVEQQTVDDNLYSFSPEYYGYVGDSVTSDPSGNDYFYYYPAEYNQAVARVEYQKRLVLNQKRLYAQGVVPDTQNQQVRIVKRGIFLSKSFAKATETTFPGILLGGASLKVNHTWLSIIPVALFIVFMRRRKNINFTKYLNSLLEIIL